MGVLGKPTSLLAANGAAVKAMDDLWVTHALPVKLGGSIRRERAIVNDVDLVIVAPHGYDDLQLLKWGGSTFDWHVTPKTATTEVDDVRIEAWWCPPDSLGPMMCFVTGPADLNVWMRTRANRTGWRLTQYVLRSFGGDRIDWPVADPQEHEQQIFSLLDLEYLEPNERDDWRARYGVG